MEFKTYPKIHALYKDECAGILEGECYIQEKIDGANASIWLGTDGRIHCGSRSRDLTAVNDGFNGFLEYVANHEGIQNLIKGRPDIRLMGEWLVRHTIGYSELSYKHFYLFDIENQEGGRYDIEEVNRIADEFNIKRAHLFGKFNNPTLEQIKEFAGTSVLGEKGEGVVIKNMSFINQFGDPQYGKYVTNEFKEDNAITFGGNNKSSETYNEMYYVNKFVTLPRVEKIIKKITATREESMSMKDIPQVMNTVYHDVITENCWEIAKDMGSAGKYFDFREFQKLCTRKAKQVYLDVLNNTLSVADKDRKHE